MIEPTKKDRDLAHWYVVELCDRHDLWLTHGLPGETKLAILEDAFAHAIANGSAK